MTPADFAIHPVTPAHTIRLASGMPDEFEMRDLVPAEVGDASLEMFEPERGLVVALYNFDIRERLIMEMAELRALSLTFFIDSVCLGTAEGARHTFRATPGELCLISPTVGRKRALHFMPNSHYRFMAVYFREGLIESLFDDLGLRLPSSILAELNNPAGKILDQRWAWTHVRELIDQVLSPPYRGAARRLFVTGKLLELISAYGERLSTVAGSGLNPRDIARITNARDRLVEDLSKSHSASWLAANCGTNECTLKRGFKQLFGKSIHAYLIEQRLLRAQQLLRDSDAPVSHVALEVGYSCQSHFTTAFRQQFGSTPAAYRLRYKN